MNRCSLRFGSKGHHFNTPSLARLLCSHSIQLSKNETNRSRTLYIQKREPVKGRSDQRENQFEDRRER